MLTLREPIQLNSQREFLTASEDFGARIAGNYALLAAHFTPKDLLFLLTAPPELPEDLGGMTTIAVQNSAVDVRTVTMDVVNHVVNRILLEHSDHFTYQDQVYITSVLSKLGITDVNLFMEQVRQLREEHSDVTRLLSLYRLEAERRAAAGERREEEPRPSAAGGQAAGEAAPGRDRYFLHDEVYRRVHTASVYETVNAFQRDQTHRETFFHSQELRTAEQLRVSQVLALSALRERAVPGAPLTLLEHTNHYELGDILPPPATEEQVLSQAAAAALVNVVDSVLTQQLTHALDRREVWRSVERALSQTAETTLARFQQFHTSQSLLRERSSRTEDRRRLLTQLRREESTLRERFREQDHSRTERLLAQAGEAPPPPPMEHISLTREGDVAEGDQITQVQVESVLSSQEITNLTRQLLSGQLSPPPGPAPAVPPAVREGDAVPPPTGEGASPPAEQVHRQEAAPDREEEAPGEALVRQLREIDRHNREVFERLQQARTERTVQAAPAPDAARTREDALRALEHPEQVLREALTPPPAMEHPKLPPEVEAVLSQADGPTRKLYESILLYQRDPQAAQAQGLLRPGNVGALNADAARLERETAELTHRVDTVERRETESVERQVTGQALERLREAPVREAPQAAGPRRTRTPVAFVHRQENDTFTEELLERLTQQRTAPVQQVVNQEQVTRQQVTETQVNDLTRQTITQTGEDITQLINRTLARQMHTISEKVYQQMEKRLQTERYRRGRF